MPTYTFKKKGSSKKTWTDIMTISEMEQYLKENEQFELVLGSPLIVSGVNAKPDNSFRDLLKNMQRRHPKGKINTF